MGRVRTDEIRRAATIVAGVGQTVRGNVPEEVGGIGAALSGSASGGAGTSLASAWARSYAALATQVEEHAQSMRDAADAWDEVDAHAGDTYRQFLQRPAGPVRLDRFTAGGMQAV